MGPPYPRAHHTQNTFKKIGHTLPCPSGAYINQIQKLFPFGQVEGVKPDSEKMANQTKRADP